MKNGRKVEEEKILLKRDGKAGFITNNRNQIVIIVPLDDFLPSISDPSSRLFYYYYYLEESFFLFFFPFLIITITNGSTRIGSIIRNIANLITLFTARRQFQSLSTKARNDRFCRSVTRWLDASMKDPPCINVIIYDEYNRACGNAKRLKQRGGKFVFCSVGAIDRITRYM